MVKWNKLCDGKVKIYDRDTMCGQPLGHRGSHSVQVEYRKHHHNGKRCLDYWLDCPKGCADHFQDESCTSSCYPRLPGTFIHDNEVMVWPKMRDVLTFDLIRTTDESGVSGTGLVLQGTIYPSGVVTARWCTVDAPASTVVCDSWEDFMNIHVLSHPTNGTQIHFYSRDREVVKWRQVVVAPVVTTTTTPSNGMDMLVEYGPVLDFMGFNIK